MSGRRPALGIALVVLGASLFVVNAGVSRVAMRGGIDPTLLTTVRVTCTFATFVVLAAFFRRSALRIPRGKVLLLVAHGVLGVWMLQWTYFVAIDRLPVGMALLLEHQAPILVALWAMFVQKRPVHPRLWLGLILAVIGLGAATEVWQGARFDTVGIIAGFGAAISLSAYFLIGEAGVARIDPLQVIVWAFGFATIALNIFSPITRFAADLSTPITLLGALDHVHVPLWLALTWIVVLGTLVPFFAELVALSIVSATTVTMIAMLEPIGVIALGWMWFGESLGAIAVLGCVAVIAGIVIAQSSRVPPPIEPVRVG